MRPFRITLTLRSALGTPLAADTLWGHIAWGIRYRQGNATLEEWLARYDQDDPPLVLGDPFPTGLFPRPVLPQGPRPKDRPDREQVAKFKKNAKRNWLSHNAWDRLGGDLSRETLAQAEATDNPAVQDVAVTHAGVNRLTGGTAQLDGGSLYDTLQSFHAPGARFDLWGYSPESLDTVRQWLQWGLEGGYGRDAATGLGHLTIDECREESPPAVENPNALMLLGPAIPRPGDPHRGFFKTTVKSGRLGGSFAIGEIIDGKTQRQKYPVTLIQAGTVLITDEAPSFLGRVISGVHESPRIRQNGIAPTLPLRLADEFLNHPLLADS